LMQVQSADMSAAFSDYRKAVADEKTRSNTIRARQLLYDKGAISLNDFQTAEDVENKAEVDVETPPSGFVSSVATSIIRPRSWTFAPRFPAFITDQQVTNAAGVAGLGSPIHSRSRT